MQYRGFNERELNKITAILEKNGVQYTVSVPDDSMDFINDPTKRVNHKFMDSLLQIEIPQEEFDKINPADLQKLFDLRIYKHEEPPFTEEELANIDPNAKPVIKPEPHARMKQVMTIVIMVGMTILYLMKKKII